MLKGLKIGQRMGLVCLVAACLVVSACGDDNGSQPENNITENNSTENNSTENNSTENNSTENNSTENNSTENNSTENNSTENNSTENNSTENNSTENNADSGESKLSELSLEDVCTKYGQKSIALYGDADDAIKGLCMMVGATNGAFIDPEVDAQMMIETCESEFDVCMAGESSLDGFAECLTPEQHQECNITEAEMEECMDISYSINVGYWEQYTDATCDELANEEAAGVIFDEWEYSWFEIEEQCGETFEQCPWLF